MIRVFSWILRFVNNCTLLNGKCKDSELSQSEIENSEKKLIRLVQSYYLPDAKSSNYIETYIDDEVKSLSNEPTPLPPDRVTDCAPFEIVGIDLAGPLFLKDGRKVWITLFTCTKHNEKESRDPQIEVVLVGDDNKKRLFWALAKIIELIPGRDGKIRTVRLKTQHGKMLRPIQRIYPLEIRSNENLQRGMEESIPTVSETLSPDEVIVDYTT
ncbi:integrase catalytic domain-containing protein [Trichonephila clavipes]|nr:integrase catalytic domain-containing protein [Trichonephila clavipes]